MATALRLASKIVPKNAYSPRRLRPAGLRRQPAALFVQAECDQRLGLGHTDGKGNPSPDGLCGTALDLLQIDQQVFRYAAFLLTTRSKTTKTSGFRKTNCRVKKPILCELYDFVASPRTYE